MRRPTVPPSSVLTSTIIKNILEWLTLAHDSREASDPEQLYRQLLLLGETPIPVGQKIKLLDLFYRQVERIIEAERPALNEALLPVSRHTRQRVRTILKLLGTLTQNYVNTPPECLDSPDNTQIRASRNTLCRVMLCVTWQIHISHLIASPPGTGLWQQAHATFNAARQLGFAEIHGPRGEASIQQIYINALLASIALPASFSAEELGLIDNYIEHAGISSEVSATPPTGSSSIFWINLDKDFPAHALIRRNPPVDASVLYFSCDAIAAKIRYDLDLLKQGIASARIGLPPLADGRAGKSVLRRLEALWGNPGKRKFPRRRQSYRTRLCAGFNNLWGMLKSPNAATELSDWMVINESPDGYALMHISGHTQQLRVGDIAAIQPSGEHAERNPVWHICIVRWALSENYEHIELGLQLLASHAIAARIALPDENEARNIPALILPPAPPLRQQQALIVETGTLKDDLLKIVIMLEKDNLKIREMHTTGLQEQTSRIEVFSVETAWLD